MSLRINSEAPDFTAETTEGTISFHEWIGNSWAILFSHPKDFTPVCTTELGYMAGLKPEFDKRNTKIIGLSVDPISNHARWAADIEETQGHAVNYPMIGDIDLKVAKLYDMLPEGSGTTADGRTAADNATVRSVFVVGPDKKIKAMLTYPMSTGRNFDEVLRLLEFVSAHRKAHGRDAGELEARRGCHHSASRLRRPGKAEVPRRLEDGEAISACRCAAARLISSGSHPTRGKMTLRPEIPGKRTAFYRAVACSGPGLSRRRKPRSIIFLRGRNR